MLRKNQKLVFLSVLLLCGTVAQAQTDPLPSWNDGASKQAIVAFVKAVSTEGNAQFVPISQRIAVFDNDGTLWGGHEERLETNLPKSVIPDFPR